MFNQTKLHRNLLGLGLLLILLTNSVSAETKLEGKMPISLGETSQFQKIEQPTSLKLMVALGGLGLISAELWWFLFSKK